MTGASDGWVAVCDADQLTVDRGVAALVRDDLVAVFRLSSVNGEGEPWYAVDHLDPRTGAAVMARGMVGSVDTGGTPTDIVVSPIHKQRYDLATGAGLDDETSLRTWRVQTVDGMVWVSQEPVTVIEP